MKRLPMRDEGAAYVRKATARRRAGNGECACGEKRPEALIPKDGQTVCAACARAMKHTPLIDHHHVAGKANSPITISVPVNDHRAELSTAQNDWPKETLRNPAGSPFLVAAACIRGFVDTILYLIKSCLLWIAEMLERSDEYLSARLGPHWWAGTDLEQFAPRGHSDAR